jgi:TM2 domain-containing membrane protein YozV
LFIPGAGQIYRGRVGADFFWLLAIPLCYIIVIPIGIILHMLVVYDAYKMIRT